jgi:subtilisin family serine protease
MRFLYKTITLATSITTAAVSALLTSTEASAFTLSQGITSFENVGLVESQGVTAMNAGTARNLFGVDGTGVTIGVISDSFNNLGEAESDVANGDLPLGINVLQDLPSNGYDEGRAIMQLIHDVAPGANLAFHTAFLGLPDFAESQAEYANAILELAEAGADIIVSDVVFPWEPMFQDGIIAQTINRVVSEYNVSYFASAGNEDRRSYESPFNLSGVTELLDGGEFHDFDPGPGVDTLQSIMIPSGSGIILSFQWDSPFFSVSGGTGSPNDLDIFLFDSSGTNVLASSANSNIGNDPLELFQFINEEPTSEFNLAILNSSDPDPGLMKYVVIGADRNFEINEYDTASGTIFGNPNARGAMAVGAAFYGETPAFGTDPARLRWFSSAGGTPILFDTAGNRLASPELRTKPAIVAPDGVNTTFYPAPDRDIPEDPDNFPNFAGTSAAAPHAAAVAALMLQANPNLSPAEIYSILQATALDMDDPSTPGFDVGFDFASGYGLIQADRALSQVTTSVPEPSSVLGMLVFGTLGAASLLKRKLKETEMNHLVRKD